MNFFLKSLIVLSLLSLQLGYLTARSIGSPTFLEGMHYADKVVIWKIIEEVKKDEEYEITIDIEYVIKGLIESKSISVSISERIYDSYEVSLSDSYVIFIENNRIPIYRAWSMPSMVPVVENYKKDPSLIDWYYHEISLDEIEKVISNSTELWLIKHSIGINEVSQYNKILIHILILLTVLSTIGYLYRIIHSKKKSDSYFKPWDNT